MFLAYFLNFLMFAKNNFYCALFSIILHICTTVFENNSQKSENKLKKLKCVIIKYLIFRQVLKILFSIKKLSNMFLNLENSFFFLKNMGMGLNPQAQSPSWSFEAPPRGPT